MSSASDTPAIFIDSHPDEQDSYLKSWLTTIRTNLTIAVTGVVERSQQSGDLRLKWFTHDGNVGFKDYPLHEYELALSEYNCVLALPDVRRAMVMGYPSQNPYIMIDGKNPWVDRFEREKKQKEKMFRDQKIRRDTAKRENFLDIDGLVEETEREELRRIMREKEAEVKDIEEAIKKKQNATKEKHVDEEEGFLSRRKA